MKGYIMISITPTNPEPGKGLDEELLIHIDHCHPARSQQCYVHVHWTLSPRRPTHRGERGLPKS
uniref:Uncharacterized protein n=1 Tax=Lepeophtheirus salmonis TaxID=72036 RepID=A0A0K2SVZ0_LEPSM